AVGCLGVPDRLALDVVAGRVVVLLLDRSSVEGRLGGAGGVRHVRTLVELRGHEITPNTVKIGTREKPPATRTATPMPASRKLRRARSLLVRPSVCAALKTPWRRCMPRATIATR